MFAMNDGARLAALSCVVPRVMTVFGSLMIERMSLRGFGVVVATTCGSGPSRRPNIIMSHDSGAFHAPTSSLQHQANCGPRNRSGSSAEKHVAMTPLGHVSRRLLDSYTGRNDGGEHASMPLSPSIMTSRTSAAVGPINAPRPIAARARSLDHSAPARVLPAPRPAMNNQVSQSPIGGS